MRNKYGFYNKLKIKKPQQGLEQSLLFITHVEHTDLSNNKKTINTFEREVDISYQGYNNEYYLYRVCYLDAVFQLSNKYKPDERLVKKLSFVFDDLLLGVGAQGLVEKVLNTDALKNRWQVEKAAINEQYEGEYITHYLKGMDDLLENEKAVIEFLQMPGMYGNYFNGLWNTFHYQQDYYNRVRYGKEAEGVTVDETVQCKLVESAEDNQVVELDIATTNNLVTEYKGAYRYFNGLLQNGERKISINNTTITYTIKWTGLQPIMN
jgi:hypothetical protein